MFAILTRLVGSPLPQHHVNSHGHGWPRTLLAKVLLVSLDILQWESWSCSWCRLSSGGFSVPWNLGVTWGNFCATGAAKFTKTHLRAMGHALISRKPTPWCALWRWVQKPSYICCDGIFLLTILGSRLGTALPRRYCGSRQSYTHHWKLLLSHVVMVMVMLLGLQGAKQL